MEENKLNNEFEIYNDNGEKIKCNALLQMMKDKK